MEHSILPQINASLNAVSAGFISLGWYFIRTGRKSQHVLCMVAALSASALFLACYLYYHYNVGSVSFQGTGWIRPVYFAVLISHTVLATLVVPFIIRMVWLAISRRYDRHKALGRWVLPVWLYVSVTGVVVYWMLYH